MKRQVHISVAKAEAVKQIRDGRDSHILIRFHIEVRGPAGPQ